MGRTNEERTATTRSALIEAVIDSLCDVGFARSTVHEVCRRAGATTGALQHHFGSKDELIIAALDRLFGEIQNRLDAFTATVDSSIEERCRRLVWELWETYYRQRRYAAVWEIVFGSLGEPGLHARVAHHRVVSLRTLQDVWRRVLVTSDPVLLTNSLNFSLSTLRGAALYGLADQDENAIAPQLEILCDTLIRLFTADREKR